MPVARDLSYSLSRIFIVSVLLEVRVHELVGLCSSSFSTACLKHALWSSAADDWSTAERWVELDDAPLTPRTIVAAAKADGAGAAALDRRAGENRQLALDLDKQGRPRGMGNFNRDGSPRSKL